MLRSIVRPYQMKPLRGENWSPRFVQPVQAS